mmetsp:Transcript_13531/g.33766  ORF Transcript_13531/g.33766 Transcript_13531/m.33766 type:complete len:313 (+) Transcript_13531:142-1080(+)
MASNTMPRCKYGLACRIITPEEEKTAHLPKEQQHWFKFQHPCFWVCKQGHPALGPPGVKCPLHPRFGMHGVPGRGSSCPAVLSEMVVPCTNTDPDHLRCFRHPADDEEVVEVVDESPDELDLAIVTDEAGWTAPELGEVSEEAAAEAKAEAAEAAAAAKLQAIQRGNIARRKDPDRIDVEAAREASSEIRVSSEALQQAVAEREAAVAKLQAIQRGNMARKETKQLSDEEAKAIAKMDAAVAEKDAAAAKLQAIQRGNIVRKKEAEAAKRAAEKKLPPQEDNSSVRLPQALLAGIAAFVDVVTCASVRRDHC